jgi:hypothetical protein
VEVIKQDEGIRIEETGSRIAARSWKKAGGDRPIVILHVSFSSLLSPLSSV